MAQTGQIPRRQFGKTGVQLSALGLGGHHLGDAEDLPTARLIVDKAFDGGVNFFDNCWEYHRGKSEVWMDECLKSKRKEVFLMSKVCTHGRDTELALKMVEEYGSQRRRHGCGCIALRHGSACRRDDQRHELN
jgi:aryl-alcohol dehydrogenase-like predicted oxidoreductase